MVNHGRGPDKENSKDRIITVIIIITIISIQHETIPASSGIFLMGDLNALVERIKIKRLFANLERTYPMIMMDSD